MARGLTRIRRGTASTLQYVNNTRSQKLFLQKDGKKRCVWMNCVKDGFKLEDTVEETTNKIVKQEGRETIQVKQFLTISS